MRGENQRDKEEEREERIPRMEKSTRNTNEGSEEERRTAAHEKHASNPQVQVAIKEKGKISREQNQQERHGSRLINAKSEQIEKRIAGSEQAKQQREKL